MQAKHSQKTTQTKKEDYGKVHDDTALYENPLGSRTGILGQGLE
jgi:hypothetical protein